MAARLHSWQERALRARRPDRFHDELVRAETSRASVLRDNPDFGARVETRLSSFSQEIFSPKSLALFLAGSLAFRVARTWAAGRLALSPAWNWATRGAGAAATSTGFGIAAESLTFTAGRKFLGRFEAHPIPSEDDDPFAEWLRGLLLSGGMRLAGPAAGLVAERAIARALASGPAPSWSDEWIQGLQSLLHMNLANRVAGGLWVDRSVRVETSSRRPFVFDFSPNAFATPRRALSPAGEMGRTARPSDRPLLMAAAGDGGSGPKRPPLDLSEQPEKTLPDPRDPREVDTMLDQKAVSTMVLPGRKGREAEFLIPEEIQAYNLAKLRAWSWDAEEEIPVLAHEFTREKVCLAHCFDVGTKWATFVFHHEGRLLRILQNPWRGFFSTGSGQQSRSSVLGIDVLLHPESGALLWYDGHLPGAAPEITGIPLVAMEALHRAGAKAREAFLARDRFARDVAVATATPRLAREADASLPRHWGFFGMDLMKILAGPTRSGRHAGDVFFFSDSQGQPRAASRRPTGVPLLGAAGLAWESDADVGGILALTETRWSSGTGGENFREEWRSFLAYVGRKSPEPETRPLPAAAFLPLPPVAPSPSQPAMPATDALPAEAGFWRAWFSDVRLLVAGWGKRISLIRGTRPNPPTIPDRESLSWKPASSFFEWIPEAGYYRLSLPKGIRRVSIGRADFQDESRPLPPALEKIALRHLSIYRLKSGEFFLEVEVGARTVLVGDTAVPPGRGILLHPGNFVVLEESIAFEFGG